MEGKNLAEISQIYSQSFPTTDIASFIEFLNKEEAFQRYLCPLRSETAIAAVHAVIPSRVVIRNCVFEARYLSYAAVIPACRGEGLLTKLLLETLQAAQYDGVDFLIMDPFQHSFYKKYGFSSAFENYCLYIPASLFSSAAGVRRKMKVYYMYENTEAFDLYCRMKQYFWEHPPRSYYNSLQMNRCFSQSKMYAHSYLALFDEDEEKGYLIYELDKDNITIKEIYYSGKLALQVILRFLSGFRQQVKAYYFENIPPDFPKERFITDYWSLDADVCFKADPLRMMRIVSLKEVCNKLSSRLSCRQSLRLQVIDEKLEENSGVYEFSGNRTCQYRTGEKFDASIDIEAFAKLLTGICSAHELWEQDALTVRNKNHLAVINDYFQPQRTFSPDLY